MHGVANGVLVDCFVYKNVLSLQCRCYQLLSLTNINRQTDFSLTMQYVTLSRKSDYFGKLVTATQCVNLRASMFLLKPS